MNVAVRLPLLYVVVPGKEAFVAETVTVIVKPVETIGAANRKLIAGITDVPVGGGSGTLLV